MHRVNYDDYLTATQTARVISRTPSRVRQMLAEGRLPALQTPLGRLIPKAAIRELLAAREAQAKKES